MSDSREVIVVGGGMAGLTAGLAAAEAGGDVLVLESEPSVGGSMALSGGLIWSPATYELARQWVPRGDPGLQRILVDELEPAWYVARGARAAARPARPLPQGPDGTRPPDGRRRPRRTRAVGGAAARRRAAPGRRGRRRARVETVEPDGDGVDRHVGPGRHRATRTSCRSVVFCGGGFQNSEELVRRYISPWPEDMVVRSNRSSDGVALRNLVPLGAPISHGMHSFYGHTLPYIEGKTWDDGLEFLAGSLYFSDFCLIVNQLGLRFTDESVGCIDEHNAERGCQQPHGALLRRLRRAHPPRAHRRRPDGHPRDRGDPRAREAGPAPGARSVDRHRRHARRAGGRDGGRVRRPRREHGRHAAHVQRHDRPDRRARPATAPRPRADRGGAAAGDRLRLGHHVHDGRPRRSTPTCASPRRTRRRVRRRRRRRQRLRGRLRRRAGLGRRLRPPRGPSAVAHARAGERSAAART